MRSKPLPKVSPHFWWLSGLWWLPKWVSIVLTTLAILAIAQHGFATWSLSPWFALMMASYNATMELVFGWAHPHLQAALSWLGSFIGWRPTLYPHWKDMFVVIGLIGISGARADWQEGVRNHLWTIGFLVGSFLTAVAAGMLPLQSPERVTQILIAASLGLAFFPLIIISLIRFGFSEFSELKTALTLSGLAAFATWMLSLDLGRAEGLGLAGIACAVILLGWVFCVSYVLSGRSDGDRHLLRWGLNILVGFVGAAFVAAVDAGVKLWGGAS